MSTEEKDLEITAPAEETVPAPEAEPVAEEAPAPAQAYPVKLRSSAAPARESKTEDTPAQAGSPRQPSVFASTSHIPPPQAYAYSGIFMSFGKRVN